MANCPMEADFSGDLCPFWSVSRDWTLPLMVREKESDGLMLFCPVGSAVVVFSSFSVSWKSLGLETSLSPRALFSNTASVLIAITERKEISECYSLSGRAALLDRDAEDSSFRCSP